MLYTCGTFPRDYRKTFVIITKNNLCSPSDVTMSVFSDFAQADVSARLYIDINRYIGAYLFALQITYNYLQHATKNAGTSAGVKSQVV